jgi:hypothetical protein
VIVDPAKINFTELSGRERVGVINRNTKERVNTTLIPRLYSPGFFFSHNHSEKKAGKKSRE